MRDLYAAYLEESASRPTVQLRRRTLIGLAAGAAVTMSWAAGVTWYLASRDELAQRFFALETEMKVAYEDRIGQLSSRLEREVTQNLVDRETYEARIGAVATRQSQIEARQSWLRSVVQRGGKPVEPVGGFAAASQPADGRAAERPAAEAKPMPLDGIGDLRLSTPTSGGSAGRQAGTPKDRLSAIERSLDGMVRDEGTLVTDIGRDTKARLSRLRSALSVAGIGAARLARPAAGATGGPLVAVPPGSVPFGLAATALDGDLEELGKLQATVRGTPVGLPLDGELEPTSPFGYRIDPFTRGAALHTGLDLRVESGSPARATAAGRVTVAEWTGGYGNMVEIDHGGGLVTRYGHLSGFAVTTGDRVEPGQIVGRTGSTGRSTGPHLHYETRVDGEPVNPVRFLEAARLLRGGV